MMLALSSGPAGSSAIRCRPSVPSHEGQGAWRGFSRFTRPSSDMCTRLATVWSVANRTFVRTCGLVRKAKRGVGSRQMFRLQMPKGRRGAEWLIEGIDFPNPWFYVPMFGNAMLRLFLLGALMSARSLYCCCELDLFSLPIGEPRLLSGPSRASLVLLSTSGCSSFPILSFPLNAVAVG